MSFNRIIVIGGIDTSPTLVEDGLLGITQCFNTKYPIQFIAQLLRIFLSELLSQNLEIIGRFI